MSETTFHTLTYGTSVIAYELSFSQRKALAIHVHPDGHIHVDAPLETDHGELTLAEIEQRVRKRAAWILRQQRNFQRYSADFPPRQYVSGETHRFLGAQYRLKVVAISSGPESVTLDREYLTVSTRQKENPDHTRQLVDAWYRQQALAIFNERVDTWFAHFERLGLSRPTVTARQMRSRWGSCTPHGKITLNTKLVMVPKTLIDSVVVHELCHLQVLNHGAQFQQLLSRVMPDWRERKDLLDRYDFG
jgi:predicted metal-dependent hydrolase